MDNIEILKNIEMILQKLQQWITYNEASFEPEELAIVKEIGKDILPSRLINYACPPCVGELLTTIWSYYQREK